VKNCNHMLSVRELNTGMDEWGHENQLHLPMADSLTVPSNHNLNDVFTHPNTETALVLFGLLAWKDRADL